MALPGKVARLAELYLPVTPRRAVPQRPGDAEAVNGISHASRIQDCPPPPAWRLTGKRPRCRQGHPALPLASTQRKFLPADGVLSVRSWHPRVFELCRPASHWLWPLQFAKWDRHNVTEMVRFENYLRPMRQATSLSDAIVGRPKKEDRARLTLCAGSRFDSMAYDDVAEFAKKYAGSFKPGMSHAGHAVHSFNHKRPSRQTGTPGAAHAIDREAITGGLHKAWESTRVHAPASPPAARWSTAGQPMTGQG